MLATKRATSEQLRLTFHDPDRPWAKRVEDVYVNQKGYVLVVVGAGLFWAPDLTGPYHEQQGIGSRTCGRERTLSFNGFKVVTVANGGLEEATVVVKDTIDRYQCKNDEYKVPIQAIFSSLEGNVWLFSSEFRRPEHLFWCPQTDEHIVTTAPSLKYSYEFDVYKGRPGAMIKEQGSISVERYRDGGTTFVECGQSNWGFYSPPSSQFGESKSPTISYYGKETYKLKRVETSDMTDYCGTVLHMDVTMWKESAFRATPLTPM